jgi:hypothetical protein
MTRLDVTRRANGPKRPRAVPHPSGKDATERLTVIVVNAVTGVPELVMEFSDGAVA